MPFRRDDIEAICRMVDEALARQENRGAVLARAAAIVRANTMLQRSAGIEAVSDCTVSALIVLLIED